MVKEKKFYKVIIVNEFNEWVATDGNTTLKQAIRNYKKEDKDEFSYRHDVEYYAFGITKEQDEEYF